MRVRPLIAGWKQFMARGAEAVQGDGRLQRLNCRGPMLACGPDPSNSRWMLHQIRSGQSCYQDLAFRPTPTESAARHSLFGNLPNVNLERHQQSRSARGSLRNRPTCPAADQKSPESAGAVLTASSNSTNQLRESFSMYSGAPPARTLTPPCPSSGVNSMSIGTPPSCTSSHRSHL